MEREKGIEYIVEVKTGKLEDYAMLTLALLNYKSSVKESVVNVKTIEGTDRIKVVSMIELDDMFKRYGATITYKEEIEILVLDSSDLKKNVTDAISKLDDNDEFYFVNLDIE